MKSKSTLRSFLAATGSTLLPGISHKNKTTRTQRLGAVSAAMMTTGLMLGNTAQAQSIWNGTTSTDWDTSTNWSIGVPASPVVANFTNAAATNTAITGIDTNESVGNFYFNSALNYSFTGSFFYVGNAATITNEGAGNIVFISGVRARNSGLATFTNNGAGLLSFTGSLGLMKDVTGNLEFTGSGNFEVPVLTKGDGAFTTTLTKNGAGTLTISSFQTTFATTGTNVSGLTNSNTINAGTIKITSGDQRSLGQPQVAMADWLTLYGGALQVSTADLAINNANAGVFLGANDGIFNVDASRTLTIGGGGATNIITGAVGSDLTKSGSGKLTLTGANTYSGKTTISTGTLALSGSGSIASSPTVIVGASTTLDVTGVTGDFTIASGQTVGGNGTILATGKNIIASGTLSPGNSPGTLTQNGGTLQLDGVNGNLNWQVLDASGAAGSGYDTTNLVGATLDLSLLSALNPYDINLWSLSSIGPDVNGNATNFNNASNYSWTLFSTGSAITGFDPSYFDISVLAANGTGGFSNALGGGSFSVGLGDSNTDLVLNFTAVPEPNVAALIGGLGLLALLRRRR